MQSFDTDDHRPPVNQGANGFIERLCVWSYVQPDLLPTDGSDGTERAVEHAIDHGTTYDAALHVLYMVESALFHRSITEGATEVCEEAATGLQRRSGSERVGRDTLVLLVKRFGVLWQQRHDEVRCVFGDILDERTDTLRIDRFE